MWKGLGEASQAALAHAPSSHLFPLNLDWLDPCWLSSRSTSSVRPSQAHLTEGSSSCWRGAPAFGLESLRVTVSKQIKSVEGTLESTGVRAHPPEQLNRGVEPGLDLGESPRGGSSGAARAENQTAVTEPSFWCTLSAYVVSSQGPDQGLAPSSCLISIC